MLGASNLYLLQKYEKFQNKKLFRSRQQVLVAWLASFQYVEVQKEVRHTRDSRIKINWSRDGPER